MPRPRRAAAATRQPAVSGKRRTPEAEEPQAAAGAAPAAAEEEVEEVAAPPKSKPKRDPREPGVCNWERVQSAVRAPSSNHPPAMRFTLECVLLAAHCVLVACCSLQAATRCYIGAVERWPKSGDPYRIGIANDDYPEQLKAICGTNGAGDGRYGPIPFPVKKRPGHPDGDWTMALSIEKRPKCKAAIYNRGKDVSKKVWNVYLPLEKRLLIGGTQLRSGWSEDDLLQAMLYNLKLAHEERTAADEKVKKEAAASTTGGGGADKEANAEKEAAAGDAAPAAADDDDDAADPASAAGAANGETYEEGGVTDSDCEFVEEEEAAAAEEDAPSPTRSASKKRAAAAESARQAKEMKAAAKEAERERAKGEEALDVDFNVFTRQVSTEEEQFRGQRPQPQG